MRNDQMWTPEAIPDLTGKTVVVTGANSGIGYEAALQLAGKRARVILACRSVAKATTAAEAIAALHRDALLEPKELDLANLASVRAFAAAVMEDHPALHVLINNAGVMALPYGRTVDGFETQLGTNHLGHFALTGLLLDRLRTAPAARIVTVSSSAHRIGKIHFGDLHWQGRYRKWLAYGQSKLANLLFAFELQRRLTQARSPVISVACHPGWAGTNLQTAGPRLAGSRLMERCADLANRLFSQSAAMGALPTLYAATAPDVEGGDYIGPAGFGEMWGPPVKVAATARAHDEAAARQLWAVSETLTAVHYAV